MKRLNKLAVVFCVAAMALTAMTGCEGSDMFSVNSPDWLSEKIDSIEKANQSTEEVLVGMNEDVYTVGNTDFSSGFWTSFSKYYQVDDNQKWNAVFNLNINPNDNTYYKNFGVVITNDADRGSADYKEYGVIRFDCTGDTLAYNSQWSTKTGDNYNYYLPFKFSESNLIMSPVDNKDAGLQKLGGKVTLTVDRSRVDTFLVKITNGTVTKTYTQPYKIGNLNADASNSKIRCFLVPEGSYIDFMQSNVEPIGGYTSAADKAPVSMVLNNVPAEVDENTPLEKAMENVSATVTFEEGITKEIPAKELYFSAINDMDVSGTKNLIVIYNKTFKGENASTPIVAQKTFEVVPAIKALHIVSAPTRLDYTYYEAPGITLPENATLALDQKGLAVQATYLDGKTRDIALDKLTFSNVPMKVGKQAITVTAKNGVKTTFDVNVTKSAATFVTPSPAVLGAEDCTSPFWGAHLDADAHVPSGEARAFSLTNYGAAANWNNYDIVLRKADLSEYGVFRSDNWGWGNAVGGDGAPSISHAGTQGEWATWLAGMNGAKVQVYVANQNGKVNILAVMVGTTGQVSTQYYLDIPVEADDVNVDFTVDNSCLKFDSASSARKHYTRAHSR